MRNDKKIWLNVAMSLALILGLTVASGNLLAAQKKTGRSAKPKALAQVETKYVCMINNQRFNKEQIAVEVEGKTYYGCCEMCKAKLQNDVESRFAIDPVSGNKVDKAKAVIGANADGKVFYFENAENLKKFKPVSTTASSK